MKNKSNTSVRLTPEAAQLLKGLAKKLGVSQTAILEIAIRDFAKANNVHVFQNDKEEA